MRDQNDISSDYCSLFFPFYLKETMWGLNLQVHLILDFSIKSNKTCTKMIPCTFSTTLRERFRMNVSTVTPATTLRGQLRQPFPADLNQRLGSFPIKSRAEILKYCGLLWCFSTWFFYFIFIFFKIIFFDFIFLILTWLRI